MTTITKFKQLDVCVAESLSKNGRHIQAAIILAEMTSSQLNIATMKYFVYRAFCCNIIRNNIIIKLIIMHFDIKLRAIKLQTLYII